MGNASCFADEFSGLSINELQAIERGQPWNEEDLQLWILA